MAAGGHRIDRRFGWWDVGIIGGAVETGVSKTIDNAFEKQSPGLPTRALLMLFHAPQSFFQ